MGANYSKDHWQADDSRKDCAKCKSVFNGTNRRHHCRNCGGIFCNNCSSKTSVVARREIATAVRVCDACYSSLNVASKGDKGNTKNAEQSPARQPDVQQQQQQQNLKPAADVIPQVPLSNAYGTIKEEAGKAYLDVAVAAVKCVTTEESQCSEQQYEFDAAGNVDLALPKGNSNASAAAIVSLLLTNDGNSDIRIPENSCRALEDAIRGINFPNFPDLIVAF
eukprot:GILI01020495.1.p1 GENE.GILI01020495.1~~GILI01020495.1.p1  ORF type:complete len:222 (-),score=20.56 GILI01020495.1:57-722(-)